MYTMGDVARCSIGGMFERRNEALLYKLFGVNTELLIDHAWGYERCIVMTDKKKIPIEQVRAIEGELFKCLEL